MTKAKEVILYGGAFNPPTTAHEAIIRACLAYADARGAEVWVMPSGTRPDKAIAVPREQRIALLEALRRDVGRPFTIHTLELDRAVPVETIDTVQELRSMYPDYRFTFVFGSDSVATMASWRGGDLLLRELDMLVVSRQGSVLSERALKAVPLEVQVPVVSSTEVRSCIAEGLPYDHLVPASVAALLA